MSDYLGNLIARSFNLGEVIQPRPVALFESPAEAGRPASGYLFDPGTIVDQQPSGGTMFDGPLATQSPPDVPQQPSGDLTTTSGRRPMGQPFPSPVTDRQSGINRSAGEFEPDPAPPTSLSRPGSPGPPKAIQPSVEQGTPRENLPAQPPPVEKSAIGRPSSRPEPDPAQPTPLPRPGPPLLPKAIQPSAEQESPREDPPAQPSPAKKSEISTGRKGANRKSETNWSPGQPFGSSLRAKPAPDPTTFPPTPEPPVQPRAARPSAEDSSRQPVLTWPKRPLVTAGNATSSSNDGPSGGRPALEPVIQQVVIKQTIAPATPSVTNADPSQAKVSTHAVEPESQTALERAYTHPQLVPLQAMRGAVIARPRVRPAPPLERAMPAPEKPAPSPEPAPTIQVTIGRVEVRATPPAAMPKKQRRKPPVMSLDEYLRQRAGGERR